MTNKRGVDRAIQQKHLALSMRVREARKKAGLTQLQLAELAGLERKSVNRIENTQLSPTVDTLIRIAIVLGCSTSSLIDGD